MKLSNFSYNFMARYLFLITLFLLVTSIKSDFTHIEDPSGTEFPQNLPIILNVQTYDDGTTLVHIIRKNATLASCTVGLNQVGLNLERILRIRVIKLDGSVKEINLDSKFDPLNYCVFSDVTKVLRNPIVIYPLGNQYILITYIKAKNSSDPTTYEEWGDVIDWYGNSKSTIFLGPSYTSTDGLWMPESTIQLNVNKKLGFLRLSSVRVGKSGWTERQQYSM
ncbi:hypothetical protein C2G38_966214 [Gigaspora rosea]|uniref:Uncharacterized protein n=1 Tax=Gigaspora rosea TaxID=44941 RepID=A0A397W9G2_9GLOM|nr:hypothetical protein C2G38_966214 [Gigaspora rosea]